MFLKLLRNFMVRTFELVLLFGFFNFAVCEIVALEDDDPLPKEIGEWP